MRRADIIAIFLSVIAVGLSYWVADRYFEKLAHLEDEMAYVWQAQVMARGQISVPSPPEPDSFLWPFVVDYNGQRFGKYPPGWPALLAVGVRLGVRSLVNPLLAGLAIWLIFRLGKRVFGEPVGLLASGLTLLSPFFLVNSGSLLSHPLGLVLSAGFALAWLNAFSDPVSPRPWRPTIIAAMVLGLLILTRPMTAFGVALPFIVHGCYVFIKGSREIRLRLASLAALVVLLGSLLFVWQFALTGNAFLNPYTLWWPYDRVGFGSGFGATPEGHNLNKAWTNTRFSLYVGEWDVFGWPMLSWIFFPFGLFVLLREQYKRIEGLLLSAVFPSLVIIYLAYWVGASLYGPRYFYEGLYSISLLSAAGISYLAGWPVRPGRPWPAPTRIGRWRSPAVCGLVAILVGFNLVFYLPPRLAGLHGLYGVQRANQATFLSPSAQKLAPALIIVHPQKAWIEYGTLLELESPFLDTPFIFIYSNDPEIDQAVAKRFPERTVYHYYPNKPYVLFKAKE